jgi:hypothetical protein
MVFIDLLLDVSGLRRRVVELWLLGAAEFSASMDSCACPRRSKTSSAMSMFARSMIGPEEWLESLLRLLVDLGG